MQKLNALNPLARGVVIFIALAVLTGIEYVLGVIHAPAILLWIVAIMKAVLVLWYFMHIGRVFRAEGGH
jgi:heme/copper-type cytochrome/quinol oxidase subunit 4